MYVCMFEQYIYNETRNKLDNNTSQQLKRFGIRVECILLSKKPLKRFLPRFGNSVLNQFPSNNLTDR